MKYFNLETIQKTEDGKKGKGKLGAAKKQYWELAKKYHPDKKDGNEEIMKEINAEFDEVLKKINELNSEEKFQVTIDNLLKYKNLTIEIIGTWIWIKGENTKEIKEDLKVMGFMWSKTEKKWYLADVKTPFKRRKYLSEAEKKKKYGCKTIETERQQQIG